MWDNDIGELRQILQRYNDPRQSRRAVRVLPKRKRRITTDFLLDDARM